ncbi:hypothetical protein ACIRTB_21070 [Streptomyces sp. NPDC101158]|uniref:hypothetical protein n=1 Tax=Streptomyces sp. NPDC101158 TaxID=3366117 RepID=UPI0038079614
MSTQPTQSQPQDPQRPASEPKSHSVVVRGALAVVGAAVSGAVRALVTHMLDE